MVVFHRIYSSRNNLVFVLNCSKNDFDALTTLIIDEGGVQEFPIWVDNTTPAESRARL